MLELVKAGGWPMLPLLLLSAVGLAIIVERFWALRRSAVLPPGLGQEVRTWAARGRLDPSHIDSLRRNSPLGELMAAALIFHRWFRARIDGYIVDMEHEAIQLMDVIDPRARAAAAALAAYPQGDGQPDAQPAQG